MLKVESGRLTVTKALQADTTVTGGKLIGSAITGDLAVTGGSVALSGSSGATLLAGSSVNISNGGVLTLDAPSNNGTSAIFKTTSVCIGAEGKLILKNHDILGWEQNSPTAINLSGEAGRKATLTINDTLNSSPASLTMTPNLVLNGHTLINTELDGTSFGTWGTTISAYGSDNTISVGIKVRKEVEFLVAGELTITSLFTQDENTGGVVKTGKGTLIVDNAGTGTSAYAKSFTIDDGTLLLKKGSSIGSGALTIERGAVLETNGNVVLGNAITARGNIRVATESSLTTSGNVSIGATVYNQGTLTLQGTTTVDLSDANLANYDFSLTGGTEPTEGNNGWILAPQYTYTIIKNDGTFTGNLTGTDSRTIEQAGNDYVYVDTVGGSTYVVQKAGTTRLSDLMGTDFSSSQPRYVQVKDGSILDMASDTAASFVLMGNGVVEHSLSTPSSTINGATLSSAWTGTVTISGGSRDGYDFTPFVNGNQSTLEFKGFTGWSTSWQGANDYNVKLTNPDVADIAWTCGSYASNADNTTVFSGKWSGTGTFKAALGASNTKMHYTYTGDISEWTGTFEKAGQGSTILTFKDSAKAINASISRTAGTLNVVVDTDASFSGSVTADAVTVNDGREAVFNGLLTVTTFTTNGESELRGNSSVIGALVDNGGTRISGTDNSITDLKTASGVIIEGNNNHVGTLEDNGSSLISGNGNSVTTLKTNGTTTFSGTDNTIDTLDGVGKLVSSGTTEIRNALSSATTVEVAGSTLTLAGMSDGSGSVSVKKDATLSLKGNTASTAGTISLEEGAVLTNEGTTSLGGTVEGSGTLKVTNGNSLTIDGSVTLGKAIENDGTFEMGSGNLSFTSFDVLDKKTTSSYYDSTAGTYGNGYESGVYTIIAGSGTLEGITSGSTTVSVGSETNLVVTVDGSEATITKAGTSGLYYINKEEVTYDDASNAADAATTEGLVLNGGNLVMNKALESTATKGIIVKKDASLTIDKNVSLDKVKIESGNMTLKGSGVYNISGANAADAAATKVDSNWTGIVNLSDSTIGGLKNLDRLSASGSTLNLSGTVNATTGTTTANMELKEGSTLFLSGTGDSAFSGELKGSGSISVSDTSSGSVSFTRYISDWTGSYTGMGSTVKFEDNAEVKADINAKSMELGNGASLNKGATLTGNMTAYDFTLGGSLTVGGNMTATSITIGDGVLAALGTNTPLINVSGSLKGLDFVINDNDWTYLLSDAVAEGAAYKLAGFGSSTGSFTLNGAGSHATGGVKFYIESTDSAVTLTKVTMGPEWVGDTTVGWTESDGFNPQQTSDGPVSFMGKGSELVQVHGKQTVTGINVDADSGVTTYTLTGGDVSTGTLSIIHGNLVIQNKLTASGLISIHNGTELTVNEGGTLTGGSMDNEGTLRIGSGSTVKVGSISGDGSVAGDGMLVVLDGKVSEKTLSTNAGTIEMDTLNDEDATLGVSGTLLVREGGRYTGEYRSGADGSPVRIGTSDKDAHQVLRASANLMVIGKAGTVDLKYTDVEGYTLGGIDTTGETVLLNNKTVDGKATPVTLVNDSSMKGGELDFIVSAKEVNNSLKAADNKPTVTTGASLSLKDVTLKVHEVENTGLNFNAGGKEKDILLFVLNDQAGCSVSNVTVDMSDCSWMTKYFTNFRAVEGSVDVIADANTGYYVSHGGQTPNGTAGLALAGKAMFRLNPQVNDPNGELAQVLDMLDNHITSGNTGAMDKLGAALAGSSLSAVGLAVADDVQRQLRSIRNRTTTMGVNQCEVNEDMPYVNGWISGDGNYRQLSESGTDAGYQVSSWGGTVGVDVDVNPNLTLGVAVSALFGDYTGKAEDVLKGDLDTQYVSLFARVSTGSWVNTFVGTLGRADVDLERTIPGVAGKTTYKTNGMMFGFLYEVARTFALNDEATTCVQPLFNMSFSHTTLDSATEGGTADTRLTTDSASLTQFSLGLGGRLQSIVGENEYNRASIFEARALLKLDFGDRYSKLNTALAALPTATVTTRSNERGVIGAELGATLTIPISQDAGSIFFE